MRGVAFFWGVLGGLAVLLGAYAFHPAMQAQPAAQSAFERVMQSKTIRCGYVVVAPLLVKDSATGQVSGPIYDIVTEVGKTLGLKIDWAEETSFAAAPEGLRTGRFDMMCANVYLRPNLMPYVEFTQPYYYIPVMVIQRKGETRFKAASDIDRPDVKVGSVDGTIPALLAAEDFKHAGAYALPENTAYSDNLLSIATHKADVSFVDPLVFGSFDKNNPNQLEINRDIPPLRIFANIFTVRKGEHDLVTMVSAAVQHLLNNGRIEKILDKYEPAPGTFLRVSPPYAKPQ